MANKRTIIIEAINEGGATKESLMKTAEVNAPGFASQLSYIRMSGQYPMVDENGVFYMGTEEDFEASKAARASKPKVALSPEEMRTKLEKKSKRAATAQTNAAKKAENNPDDKVIVLKSQVADMQLEICEIELGRHQEEFPDLEDSENVEVEEVEEGDTGSYEETPNEGEDEELM